MQKDKKVGQGGLFDDFDLGSQAEAKNERRVWPPSSRGRTDEVLAFEKELLGFYVSGHPLDSYRGHFDSTKHAKIAAIEEITDMKGSIHVAGILSDIAVKYTKKDKRAFATLSSRISPARPKCSRGRMTSRSARSSSRMPPSSRSAHAAARTTALKQTD